MNVFHTIYPTRQNWKMILCQTKIINIFAGSIQASSMVTILSSFCSRYKYNYVPNTNKFLGKNPKNYEGVRDETHIYKQELIKLDGFYKTEENEVKEHVEKRKIKRKEVAEKKQTLEKKKKKLEENKQIEKEMQDKLRELNKVFKDIREKKMKVPKMSKTLNVK